MWNTAENKLREVLNELGVEYFEAIGEAAFYGPKLDVEVKPAIGPEITLSTCQLDFLLPRRFELTYIDKNGEKATPVVLHRAIFGTFDRFTAFIIEETKGVFPLWLAPEQVTIVPVHHEMHLEYAKKIEELLLEKDIRVNVDARNEKLGYRIREAQIKKVPVEIVVGENEVSSGTVNVRRYGKQGSQTMTIDELVETLVSEIKNRVH